MENLDTRYEEEVIPVSLEEEPEGNLENDIETIETEADLENSLEKLENQEELNENEEQVIQREMENMQEDVTQGFRSMTEAMEIEVEKNEKPSVTKEIAKNLLWTPFKGMEVGFATFKVGLWATSFRSMFLTVLSQMANPEEKATDHFAWGSFDNKVAGLFGQRAKIFSDVANYPELDRKWEIHKKNFYELDLAKRSKLFGKFKDWFWKEENEEEIAKVAKESELEPELEIKAELGNTEENNQ